MYQLVPGKKIPKPPKVHYGVFFALCGQKRRGILLSDSWTDVDCRKCIDVMQARHDKPSR